VHASTGALEAQASVVASTAVHTAPSAFTATGDLIAWSAEVAGTATHLTVHTATGDLIAGAAQVYGYDSLPVSTNTGAGSSKKRRERKPVVVEIDGKDVVLESAQEAEELLSRVRAESEEAAETALKRASSAQKRPARKVIADARKALQVPEIFADTPAIQSIADRLLDDIQALYQSTINTIEIGALLRRQQALDEDDEDVILLLL
jgi:hypothetical protein